MPKDVPIASLLRVERGVAAPEELAAIAVVVACYAGRPPAAATRPQAQGPAAGAPRYRHPAAGQVAGPAAEPLPPAARTAGGNGDEVLTPGAAPS